MENEFLKMMPKEQILKAFDEMMDFVKSDSPTAIDYLREIRDRYAAQPEIVRCKDCKHKGDSYECRFDRDLEEHGWHRTDADDDWFCADGERQEGK